MAQVVPRTGKVRSKILGTGKDIIRCMRDRKYGSRAIRQMAVFFTGPSWWTILLKGLIPSMSCEIREGDVERCGMHFSNPVKGSDGRWYHFGSKSVFLGLDASEKPIPRNGYPEDGIYHICLVCWTHMSL